MKLPQFPLAVLYRPEPNLKAAPVAVVEGESSRSTILLCNTEARKWGVRAGFTLSQAQTLCPTIIAKKRSLDLEKRAWEEVLSFLSNFSPLVENGGAGTAFLDLTGLNRHQSVETEAKRIQDGITRLGFASQIGLARTKSVAEIAAKVGKPYLLIPTGRELEFLAPLPVELLPLGPELHHSLAILGISTIGAFAKLPLKGVLLRFGQEAAKLHRIANGRDPSTFVPLPSPSSLLEELDFDYPVSTLAGLAHHLGPVVEGFLWELKLQNRFPAELKLMVKDREGQTIEKVIAIEIASDRPPDLVGHITLALTQEKLSGPVEKLVLEVTRTVPLPSPQITFFPAPINSSTVWKSALKTLSIICGKNPLNTCQIRPSHLPELSFTLKPFSIENEAKNPNNPERKKGKKHPDQPGALFSEFYGLVLLENPMPISPPLPITSLEGPWRLSSSWWAAPVAREYYRGRTAEGEELLVYYEPLAKQWFLQGYFD